MSVVAERIAAEIRKRAGGRVRVGHFDYCCETVDWAYDCPCGEVSGYGAVIDDMPVQASRISEDAFVEMHVRNALEAMRRHVRSEGNEPSF